MDYNDGLGISGLLHVIVSIVDVRVIIVSNVALVSNVLVVVQRVN